MEYDEVIQEVWRIKDEIAVHYHCDVHEYVAALREKRKNTNENAATKSAGPVTIPHNGGN